MQSFHIQISRFHSQVTNLAKIVPSKLKGKSKSSQEWLSRQFVDPYVQKAKILNYRCRSAFKLIEIDEKFNIFHSGQVILDCGAAPGSWTQVAVSKTNANGTAPNRNKGLVIGMDLLPIYPIEGATVIGYTDFTKIESQNKIREILQDRRVDCVLSDMAPNATGIKDLDQENIISLCYSVLRFAVTMSSPGANLLVKVWDNGEVPILEKDMLKFYKTVKFVKPRSSRNDSAEKFVLGKGFLGLKE